MDLRDLDVDVSLASLGPWRSDGREVRGADGSPVARATADDEAQAFYDARAIATAVNAAAADSDACAVGRLAELEHEVRRADETILDQRERIFELRKEVQSLKAELRRLKGETTEAEAAHG